MLVGVLALQGDFREHIHTLESLGVNAVGVRYPRQLADVDALVIPGGESTAISKLASLFGLIEPLRDFAASKPVMGTCAGLILLSDEVEGALPDQELIGGLPIRSSRNAYGGQTHSFEADVDFNGVSERVAFIRAPKILNADRAEVIASLAGQPVAVRSGNLFGASFHPEVTGGKVLHRLFLEAVAKGANE